MKRFSFNLEKLLGLRLYQEREAELALARAIGQLNSLEQQLQALADERALVAGSRFSAGKSVAEIQVADRYLLRLHQLKDRLLLSLAKAELVLETARADYQESLQRRKVLDKLKAKQQADYRRDYFLEETKINDDLTSGRLKR